MRLGVTIAILLTLAAGSVGWATSGFRAFTSEEVRRLAVAETPVVLPEATVVLTSGESKPLHELLRDDGRITLVTFIYTRCTGLCAVMGNELLRIQRQIVERGLEGQVSLLTLSFDPNHDSTDILAEYANNIGADSKVWRLASVPNADELQRLLEAFGIVAVPDGNDGFEHNAAFHVTRPDSTLVAIVEAEKPKTALGKAVEVAAR